MNPPVSPSRSGPTAPGVPSRGRLDPARVRGDFPILARLVHGRPLVYLDNAATTQKPRAVVAAEARFYEERNANVHRGVHLLSQEATDAYEAARAAVARFVGAASPSEIVFTRGTTESVNLVAASLGRATVRAGDEVLLTEMEHHSNIVPWQMLCEAVGASLRVLPFDDRGVLDLDRLDDLLTERTRVVAVVQVSNALGTENPVEEIARRAHAVGARVLVDGAQAVPHRPVDVRALGCDFYAFSGHKIYGPMGIGVLYGRQDVLATMPPWQGGGDMIRRVSFAKTTYADPPARFEAGTPNVAGAVGLAEAIRYVEAIGLEAIAAHEHDLLEHGSARLAEVPGLRILGTAPRKSAVLSFVLSGVHPHDVGTVLDQEGIAVRTGHHCAHPVMEHFGVPATTRASLGLYNTRQDLDALVEGLAKVREVFS